MKKTLIAAGVLALGLGTAETAFALDCPNSFKSAEAAIAKAQAAMKMVKDKSAHGLVHTLIDDAKSVLESSKHNHAKPAAGIYDHARSVAKARSATAYAEAAEILAGKSM
jgi:hypothetical protein